MRGVRVTFNLRMPMVVPTMAKPLDAVLSAAAVNQALHMDAEEPFLAQHDIGIARHQVGNDWCFMASNLQIDWDEGAAQSIHYIRRQTLDQYLKPYVEGLFKKRPSVDTSRGSYAAASLVQPTRWVSKIEAWAMVDNVERFATVLKWVSHIGKLHHKDFGAVASATFEDDETAQSRWIHRSLPAGSALRSEQHADAIGGLNSPYWDRSKHGQIAVFLG